MISLDKLRKIRQIFFHASCPDGTASAVIAAVAYNLASTFDDFEEFHKGDDDFPAQPKFIPLQYNTELMDNLVPQKGQMFIDITPPRHRWEDWKEFEPIVLDHHVTSENITIGLNGVYGTNDKYSGAMLAFDYVLQPIVDAFDKLPFDDYELSGGSYNTSINNMVEWNKFASLAMIRDTWKKDDPRWKEACEQAAALQFFGSKDLVRNIQDMGVFDFEKIKNIGSMLFSNTERRARKIAEGAFHSIVSDNERTYNVSFFNCTDKLISDIGNVLLENGSDIAVGYFYLFEEEQQRMCVSLRSKSGVSVSGIAKILGGGGHDQAAGFTIHYANSISPSHLSKYVERGLINSKDPSYNIDELSQEETEDGWVVKEYDGKRIRTIGV